MALQTAQWLYDRWSGLDLRQRRYRVVSGWPDCLYKWETGAPDGAAVALAGQNGANITIVGAAALVTVLNGGGGTTMVLVSAKVGTSSGELVGINADTKTVAQIFPTKGTLAAGPSVGVPAGTALTHIAIVTDQNGIVHGINVDGVAWSEAWSSDLGALAAGEQFLTEAAIGNNRIFLASFSHLFALDLSTGAMDWNISLQDSPVQTPAVASNGYVYVAVDTVIKTFRASDGSPGGSTVAGSTQGLLNVRPSIAPDGTVYVADSQEILAFH
jgi:outer membrane protein assembly factor BamB